jgi:hypothetical protein
VTNKIKMQAFLSVFGFTILATLLLSVSFIFISLADHSKNSLNVKQLNITSGNTEYTNESIPTSTD